MTDQNKKPDPQQPAHEPVQNNPHPALPPHMKRPQGLSDGFPVHDQGPLPRPGAKGPRGERTQDLTVRESENVKPVPPVDPAALVEERLAKVDQAVNNAQTLEEKMIAACKQVYDPEIPVDIWELGLIYNFDVDQQNNVTVTMTLTSPACPAAQELPMAVQRSIARIAEVRNVEVDITFDPPWSQDNMSDEAKFQLGFL